MSISNQRSSSSASRRTATKRYSASGSTKNRTSARKGSSKQSGVAGSSKKLSTSRNSLSSRANNGRGSTLNLKGSTKSQVSTKAQVRRRESSQASSSAQQGGFLSTATGAVRNVFIGAIVVAILALVAVIVLLVMSHLPVFVIDGIDAVGSEHVSAETVAKLANIEEGTTLLSLDTNQITENIKKNPWVSDVTIKREFPSTLGLEIQERQIGAIVIIGAGTSVWSIGSDGIWIEPVQLDTTSLDVTAAALARAQELGCLLISDVPATVDPAQGSPTTDDTILAVLKYQEELPSDITSQARVYYASSEGSISVVLDSGLEVSLGSPEDINAKSQALTEIMATYPNQLTYINVRVASKPTYRKVPDGTSISSVNDVVASNVAETAASTDDSASQDTSSEDGSSSEEGAYSDQDSSSQGDTSSGDSE